MSIDRNKPELDNPAREARAEEALRARERQPKSAPDLSSKQWERERAEQDKRWASSAKGRVGIRLFSRGIMGALGFAVGGWWAGKRMKGYTPFKPVENEVQGIARFFDVAFGGPIKNLVDVMGHDGKAFTTFRPTVQFEGYASMGRSLGHEVTMVTFDFASMSFMDFWGRRMADAIDPNTRLAWKNEDGSINPEKALQTFGKNMWTALTYSAGEDWAVAVPYVLSMRHIGTPLLNKVFPGAKYSFDQHDHGSFLVDDKGKIKGNFTAANVLDLWWRFTWYNQLTLPFREAYQWTGQKLNEAAATGQMPSLVEPDPHNPHRNTAETMVDGAKQFSRWMARDMVKGGLYMVPAVPFFWATRVPQNKFKGLFIHPEKGMLMYGEGKQLRANSNYTDRAFSHLTPVYFSKTGERAINPFGPEGFDHYAHTQGFTDTLLAPFGKLCDWARYNVARPIRKKIKGVFGSDARITAEKYVLASISYTPYFAAKSDVLAYGWDTGRTDLAIERMVDGATTLSGAEVAAGAMETWQSIAHGKLKDPKREAEAQARIAEDFSASDSSMTRDPGEPSPFISSTSYGKHHDSQIKQRDKRFISQQVLEKMQPASNAIN